MDWLSTPSLKRFRFSRSILAPALAGIAFAATLSHVTPARADLKVCNDTETLVGVAVGYKKGSSWISEGWWQLPKDVCTSIVKGDLNARYYYLHAEEARTGGRWQGPVFMCTTSKEFKINGLKNCFSRGFERTGFFEVDTGEQKNWQVRLTDKNKKAKSQ